MLAQAVQTLKDVVQMATTRSGINKMGKKHVRAITNNNRDK